MDDARDGVREVVVRAAPMVDAIPSRRPEGVVDSLGIA
jgi:hypothetical protein